MHFLCLVFTDVNARVALCVLFACQPQSPTGFTHAADREKIEAISLFKRSSVRRQNWSQVLITGRREEEEGERLLAVRINRLCEL